MATQVSNIFPLFFTLEKVQKGYILTAKEDTGGMKEATFKKEVVTDAEINSRIGRLLHLDALTDELPTHFRVDGISEGTFELTKERDGDELSEAKLAFVNIHGKDIKDGTVLVLHVKDTNTLEVVGSEAEKAARENNMPLTRVGGIPMLVLPNSKESSKVLIACFTNISLHDITHQQVLEWYEKNRVKTGK